MGNRMIWCVEDDDSIRDIEIYTLKSTGFEARGFVDGDSFWKELISTDRLPELVLMDIMLPGEDGIALLKKMRELSKTEDIPVIMATAKGMEFDKVQSLDIGADDYLVKPFEYTRFKAALDRFAEMKKYLEDSHANLDQHAIDRLVSGSEPTTEAKPTLAKGLNETTLNMVREYLMANPDGFFTSEQIAEQIHLSRITIRRYMNYMVDTGEIISTIDYKTGGRPSIKYGFGKK